MIRSINFEDFARNGTNVILQEMALLLKTFQS